MNTATAAPAVVHVTYTGTVHRAMRFAGRNITRTSCGIGSGRAVQLTETAAPITCTRKACAR